MPRFPLSFLLLLLVGCASTALDPGARSRLETTPRHNEWVQIARDSRSLHAYVTYPEVSGPAPAVILIHENRGLTDWERSVADRLSQEGFLVIAPDLLSGAAPGGGKASDFASLDAAREAIGKLPREQVMADLNATASYVLSLPGANGTVSVAGFCWGGARVWDFANARKDLAASFVFYGTGPTESPAVANITSTVFGFYGGNDARVNATIPRTTELMESAGRLFEPTIYEGAGHAFMRAGEAADASEGNRRARNEAWTRWLAELRKPRPSARSNDSVSTASVTKSEGVLNAHSCHDF